MMPVFCRWSALLLLVLLLGACGLVVRPREDFGPVSRDYVERLRWRDYQAVAAYLPEADREDFLQRFSSFDDLHIVDVQMEAADFGDDGRQVRSTVAVEYYLIPSITVKKARLHQKWRYEGGDRYHPGVWRLVEPFPPFP